METAIRGITESNLNDIPETCSYCIYWSFPDKYQLTVYWRAHFEKDAW